MISQSSAVGGSDFLLGVIVCLYQAQEVVAVLLEAKADVNARYAAFHT
jgi:hypothetical protein